MKILKQPVLMTILFGILCGMSFIPLKRIMDYWFFWPDPVCLTLWLFTAGYTLMLCLWSRQNLTSVSFPILFLFLTVFLVQSKAVFFYLALAGIGWIRSGVCYQGHGRNSSRLLVEVLLGVLGGVLVAVTEPTSTAAWTLGIWLFFLLQALYFAIFSGRRSPQNPIYELKIDPFERASRQAEIILSTPPPV